MPIASGFSQDPNPNPNYTVRKPGKTEILDEAIYYKRDMPYEKPVEVIDDHILLSYKDVLLKIANRPVVKETVFLPDRKAPPIATARDMYTVAPSSTMSTYPVSTIEGAPRSSFNLIRALGLNADCPCWSWILIIFSIVLLLALIGMCLYFILDREGRI